MAPPNARPGTLAAERTGPDGFGSNRPPSDTVSSAKAQELEAARLRLDARLEQLETIADWRDDLHRRIRRRRLVFELATVGGEQDSLIAEVETFKLCCRALAWPGRGAA
jgi:hypothetical protein